ncbi:WD40/YVTN/BNR-like repeat-containing protein [Amorphoplanes digitatis]|uniref:Uncharacterized protein n=1 Tax=Actinoplanes digitatis TaxID=1868 RepID=A0A7W7MTU8_9ACTN|nr:hypothetical protein [Actinoplanes digitatis]MBB4766733.1 hypothetical protein [Actinoplanes digitatis]GID96661.1 hypothetical protein Adi01nite_60730 [Actinoplanes digitatis]
MLRACLALVLLVAGCSAAVGNAWAQATLPGPGPHLVRDATACGGRWYAVGGRAGAGGETSPAAWDSADGRTWRSLELAPLPGSYYGPRSVLRSVACANGRIAAVGSRGGGAHGNPRVSTWYQRGEVLAEAPAPFETYGGDTAVDVGPISGGPAGFLIAGNRTSGAAAWISADGTDFRLFEGAPGLAGRSPRTLARAGAVLDGRFVLVGALGAAPAAWTSRDGTAWTRSGVPVRAGVAELQRVVPLGPDLIAVGTRDDTFGAWRGPAWTPAGRFGRADGGGVRSLAVAGGRLYAVAGGLWRSTDGGRSWLSVITPRGAGLPAAVAARDDQVLLVATDRVWLANGV